MRFKNVIIEFDSKLVISLLTISYSTFVGLSTLALITESYWADHGWCFHFTHIYRKANRSAKRIG